MTKRLKNQFSWSQSRDNMFRECLRKYYFQYYGYWEGWNPDAETRCRQIYILKNLQSRHMWAGSHVHKHIEYILQNLKAGLPGPSEETVIEKTLQEMRLDFKASRSGAYRASPKKVCGLFEHEYALDVSDQAWKATADHVAQCIHTFYQTPIFKRIKEVDPLNWLEIEKLATFHIDELNVFVQLDFGFKQDDQLIICDWKTGRSNQVEQITLQMGCYTLYAMERWNITPENIIPIEVNLAEANETEHLQTEDSVDAIRDYIRESADEMLFPLEDPVHNVAREETFDVAETDAPCKRCNFLKVCPKWA